jgi:hypothetical protein
MIKFEFRGINIWLSNNKKNNMTNNILYYSNIQKMNQSGGKVLLLILVLRGTVTWYSFVKLIRSSKRDNDDTLSVSIH